MPHSVSALAKGRLLGQGGISGNVFFRTAVTDHEVSFRGISLECDHFLTLARSLAVEHAQVFLSY